MECDKCDARTHRDDAMNRRCNDCERLVRQCICTSSTAPTLSDPTNISKGTSEQ